MWFCMGDISGSDFIFVSAFFLIQVLGAKYKHELLVDHSFPNSAGSCGKFLLIRCVSGFFYGLNTPQFTQLCTCFV